jgi:hypothetical protein
VKVTVTVMGAAANGLATAVETTTEGGSKSNVMERVLDAVLVLPARSVTCVAPACPTVSHLKRTPTAPRRL